MTLSSEKMERDELEAAKEDLLAPDDDDLEFHITFPSPVVADVSGPTLDDEVKEAEEEKKGGLKRLVSGDDPEPVVFLLGWAGCNDEQLARYSRLYETLGCCTVRYTAPAEYAHLSPSKVPQLAAKLLDLVEDMSMQEAAVFVHAFGNNGASVYRHMTELMHRSQRYTDNVLPQFSGVIFDCAPSRGTASAGEAVGVWTKSAIGKLVLPPLLLLLAYVLRLVTHISDLLCGGGGGEGEDVTSSSVLPPQPLYCYDYLAFKDPAEVPALFCFSSSDAMAPAGDVEEAADAREMRLAKCGSWVQRAPIADGDHNRLLDADRRAYSEAVCTFVARCLRESGDKERRTTSVDDEEGKKDQ